MRPKTPTERKIPASVVKRLSRERAAELRDKYRHNPYIGVKGFSIGLPLTLTIDFEFKERPAGEAICIAAQGRHGFDSAEGSGR